MQQPLRALCGVVLGTLLAFSAELSANTVSLGPELHKQATLKSSKKSAETLYSITHAALNDQAEWRRVSYYSIRINDQEAARDYGRISIPYNHYYYTAELLFANVLSRDGVVKAVSEDAIQVRTMGGGQDFYDDQSEIVFSLPDVEPGSIIEFQYLVKTLKRAITTVEYDTASPYWFQARVAKDGWRADAVRNFSYRVESPADIDFIARVYGKYPSTPSISRQGNRTLREWQWKKVDSVVLEGAMLPEHRVMPSIKLGTSEDWSLVNSWTWQKVQDKLAATDKIEAAAASMGLAPDATRQEKIRAVYSYVNNHIRYVFAHLGRGGYTPHFPDETLSNGYGDCKDQTVLAVALLKALGVKAYPALVETPRSGKADMALVRLVFDHMIVWLPATENEPAQWLDTTGDRTLFPGVSNFLLGQNALIVNEQSGLLTQVDAQLPPNRVDLQLVYRESPRGYSEVVVDYLPSGIFEQSLRAWWKHDTNRQTSLQRILEGIFSNPNEYTVEAEVHNSEDLYKPLEIRALFTFNRQEDDHSPPSYGTSFNQVSSLAGELSSMQLPSTRKNIWHNPTPIELSLKSRFEGRKHTAPALIQSGKTVQSDYFSFTQSGKREGKDFIVSIQYRRPAQELSLQEYAEFHEALVELGGTSGWLVSMQEDELSREKAALAQKLQQIDKGGFENQIALAWQHINLGEFESALVPAKEAVRLAPENGEAWYVLGTAQGFNTMIEESNNSFERARSLGYTP